MVIRTAPITWAELQFVINSNRLDDLGRSVKQTEEYENFKWMLHQKRHDMTTNLLVNSLHWLPSDFDLSTSAKESLKEVVCENPEPFKSPHDITIVYNAFPYYYAENDHIVHLCIWVKFPMDPDTKSPIGDIPKSMKEKIQRYIDLTFGKLGIKGDDIVWWKNPTALQSIRSLPHIHVAIKTGDDANMRIKLDKLVRSSRSVKL